MPFVAAVVSAIIGAIEAIGSIIATIGSAIGSAIAAGGAALGTIVEDVFKEIGKTVGGALGAMFHLSGLVLGSIDQEIITVLGVIEKVVNTVNTFVQGILKPIEDLMSSISALFDVINRDYQAITTLVDELHADLHNGIQGLLQIPKTIADALASVESQTVRAVQQLNKGSAATAKDILVPGMSSSIGDPLKNLGTSFSHPVETDYDLTKGLQPARLETCGVGPGFNSHIARIQAELLKPSHLIDYLGKVLSDIGWLGIYLEASVVADIECVKQVARSDNPSELLGVGDVIEGLYRGILGQTEAENEVRRRGFSPDRFQTLKENAQWLPGLRESFLLFWRGLISHDELVAILQKLHLTKADAEAMEGMIPEPPNPRELIQTFSREVAQGAGFLGKSFGSVAPDGVRKAYLPLGLSENRAELDWLMHWRVPDVDWWLTRYVRGLGSLDDAKNAAVSLGYPDEILDDLLPVFQETIQLWMIPDILGAGLLTEQEALDYLHYIGIGPKSAAILVKWGATKLKAPLSAQAATLQAVSVSNAKKMFQDGIIQQATYQNILEAHGYTVEAAQLTVALAKQELDITARKNYVTGLIAEVDAGLLTEQQMVDDLYSNGYSEVQIVEATNKIKAAKVAKVKQPTKAEYTDFLRYGVIDGDTYLTDLQAIGYSAQSAAYFYALEVEQHGPPPKPVSTDTSGS